MGELISGLIGAVVGGAIGVLGTWWGTDRAVKAASEDARRQAIGTAVSRLIGVSCEMREHVRIVRFTIQHNLAQPEQFALMSELPALLGRVRESHADLRRMAPSDLNTAAVGMVDTMADLCDALLSGSASTMTVDDPHLAAVRKAERRLLAAARQIEGLTELPAPVAMDSDPPDTTAAP